MNPSPLGTGPVVTTTPWAMIGTVAIVATTITVGGIVIYYSRGPAPQPQQHVTQAPTTTTQPAQSSQVQNAAPSQTTTTPVATATAWNLVGNYSITFYCISTSCTGTYPHTMSITTEDRATGDFSGTGRSITDPKQTWTIKGNTVGNSMTFSTVYTTDSSYTGQGSGVIDANGNLTGMFKDSHKLSFTWKMLSGKATKY